MQGVLGAHQKTIVRDWLQSDIQSPWGERMSTVATAGQGREKQEVSYYWCVVVKVA